MTTKHRKIHIGDRIQFRAPVRGLGAPLVWRRVNGMCQGRPTVRYAGWVHFIVRRHEIEDHEPK